MNKTSKPIMINSVSALHKIAGIAQPLHPLVSIISFTGLSVPEEMLEMKVVLNLYSIFIKKKLKGKLKYGQSHYDFDEGIMGMTAPGQLMSIQDSYEAEGWWLLFHPDFIQGYPLATTISKFSFFAYEVNEALHLSGQEESLMERVFENIVHEYNTAIDIHSQEVMIAQIELLLNYTNRYYGRQFITRKIKNQAIISKFEGLLSDYFNNAHYETKGLPSVQYFANLLNVSSHYLSDMLRKHTGQNTQQHLHQRLIEKAKEILSTTDLTINEVAYLFGFEHPQSFSKMFKSKTNLSPLQFRQSFN